MIKIELDLPDGLDLLRFPKFLDRRLQNLLDKRTKGGKLSRAERQEAEGLVNLADLLTLLRLRAERAKG